MPHSFTWDIQWQFINYHCCVWGRTASVRLYQYPCLLVTHPEEAAELWSPTILKYEAQTFNGSSHSQSEINLNFRCFWKETDCCTTTFSICQLQGPTLLLTLCRHTVICTIHLHTQPWVQPHVCLSLTIATYTFWSASRYSMPVIQHMYAPVPWYRYVLKCNYIKLMHYDCGS